MADTKKEFFAQDDVPPKSHAFTAVLTVVVKTMAKTLGWSAWRKVMADKATSTQYSWVIMMLFGLWAIMMSAFTYAGLIAFASASTWITVMAALVMGYSLATTTTSLVVSVLTANYAIEGTGPLVRTIVQMTLAMSLALVSSAPLQMAAFAGEIKEKLDTRELESRRAIVLQKILDTERRYDHEVDQIRGRSESAAQKVLISRIPGQDKLTAKQARDREFVNARFTSANISPFDGGATHRKVASADTAETDRFLSALDKWEVRADRERRAYEAETDRVVKIAYGNPAKEIELVVARKKGDLDDLYDMKVGEDWSSRFGATWNISRGLTDRFRVLHQLSAGNTYIRRGCYGIEAGMAALVFVMMLLRVLAGRVLGNYVAIVALALGGDEQAQQKLRSLGYDHENSWHVLLPWRIQRLRARLLKAQFRAIDAYHQYEEMWRALCAPIEGSVFCRSVWEIQRQSHSMFRRVLAPSLAAIEHYAQALSAQGFASLASSWPKGQWLSDPREMTRHLFPWEITASTLVGLGWVDPVMKQKEIDAVVEQLRRLRAGTRPKVHEFTSALVDERERVEREEGSLQHRSMESIASIPYAEVLAPHLVEIDLLTQRFVDWGMAVPEISGGVMDEKLVYHHYRQILIEANPTIEEIHEVMLDETPPESKGFWAWLRSLRMWH